METLEENQFQLTFTDPPYNLGFRGKHSSRMDFTERDWKFYYPDSLSTEEYWEFNDRWLTECLRVSKGVLFTPGMCNLWDWVRYRKPDYELKGWYRPNPCDYRYYEPIIAYGSVQNMAWLYTAFRLVLKSYPRKMIHPCPKSYLFIRKVFDRIKPESVFDPFGGAGTTGRVCEERGIPWLACELHEEYAPDVEYMISQGMRHWKRQQATIKGVI